MPSARESWFQVPIAIFSNIPFLSDQSTRQLVTCALFQCDLCCLRSHVGHDGHLIPCDLCCLGSQHRH